MHCASAPRSIRSSAAAGTAAISANAIAAAGAAIRGMFAGNGGPPMAKTISDFELDTIDGGAKKLADYTGQVLLVVNVASKCGLTPHYQGLQELHEHNQGRGFAVLGFPCNQFGGQEPGTNADVKSFCSLTYG